MILDTDRIEGDREYREELRFRCVTDHLFLAPLLGFHDFIPRLHKPAADLYVQKKPGLPIREQDPIKFRMHLDPRGTFKTTLGIVDTVQWILLSPDITIANETATQPLAEALTKATASKFLLKNSAARTPLQALFPEHCVAKLFAGCYWSPARTMEIVEPTIYSTSVNTSQSGWHPWILNPDDAVNTVNSGIAASDDARKAVISMYRTDKNTLRFGGYIHMRGTRYHPFDLYGDTLSKIDRSQWKLLIRSSLAVDSGERLIEGEFPEKTETTLNFPELLSYEVLRGMFFEDYEAFMCQQQNDPQGGAASVFTETSYDQAALPPERISPMGEVQICWRMAYPGKDFMHKHDEGVAVRLVEGHAYVIDAWRGASLTPTRRAEKIVAACRKHDAGAVMVEAVPGSQHLEGVLLNEAMRRNVSLRIEWLPFEDDDNVRAARIKQLEPQMKSGRFSISTQAGNAAELRKQFVHYGLVAENGLIDCASQVAQRIPVSLLRTEITADEREAHERRRRRLESEMVYGQMAMAQQAEDERLSQMVTMAGNSYGLPEMLGGLDG